MNGRVAVLALCLLGVATADAGPSVRAVIGRPASELRPFVRRSGESPYIYLNRCAGGCQVIGGMGNDATQLKSNIPPSGQFILGEFATETGQTGSAADEEWDAVVQCMKEVYSPFAVTITDQAPVDETYTELLIAGTPAQVDQPADYLGVATVANNCSPVDDVLGFAFANVHPGSGTDRIYQICWTAAQESAHAFGLDHEYQFTDGESACRDPMTYRTDCLGEKFFRDLMADCGEYSTRPCRCSATQNSAAMLLSVFGSGTPITAPPVVAIDYPADGSPIETVVHANASAQRGVATVDLYINGSRYVRVFSSVAYGPEGQPAAEYTLNVPASIPPGTLDVVVRAADDLGIYTDSAPITLTNGSACTGDGDCLANQTCAQGLCAYPPPAAELGSACSYDQQCTTWECGRFSTGAACTSDCMVDDDATCPAGYACVADGNGDRGLCAVAAASGCCSAGGSPTGALALAVPVLGIVLRRRGPLSARRRACRPAT